MSDVSTALGVRLYPDLVEPGGLAPALADAAARHRLDLGQVTAPDHGRARFTCAEISSPQGVVCVALGSQARYFMINLRVAGEVQAHGDATDLVQVAQVAAAWQAGATIAELTARFPYMEEMKRYPVAQAS
jgi:hypothetical protein